MLFASSPWTTPANRWGQQRPGVMPPQQMAQPLSQFTPPQVQWPTAPQGDMQYAQQLAQYYGSQMPQQQVPGSAPMFQPPQQGLPTPQQPGLPGQQGDWRHLFQQQRQDWRQARPEQHGTDAWSQWKAAKPQRSAFGG